MGKSLVSYFLTRGVHVYKGVLYEDEYIYTFIHHSGRHIKT